MGRLETLVEGLVIELGGNRCCGRHLDVFCYRLLMELLSILSFSLQIERDVVCKEGLADAEALINKGLRRLELGQQLRLDHVLLDDGSEALIVDVLQERVSCLVLCFVQSELSC